MIDADAMEVAAVDARLNGHEWQAPAEIVITLATADDIIQHWDFIHRGLTIIRRKTEYQQPSLPMGGWTPQHVRQALLAGCAAIAKGEQAYCELWLARRQDGTPVAFSVTQPEMDVFLNVNLCLHVWLAYKLPQDKSDVVERMDTFLAEVARSRGYETVQMMTRRQGLLKRLARYGWREHMVVCRKPLWSED